MKSSHLTHYRIFLAIICLFYTISASVIGRGNSPEVAVRGAQQNAIRLELDRNFTQIPPSERESFVSNLSGDLDFLFRSFNIISTVEEFGLHSVRAKATINVSELENHLISKKMISVDIPQPCLMVILEERSYSGEGSVASASMLLENHFAQKGYRIIDRAQWEKLQQNVDGAGLADLAYKSGADVIIRGTVNVNPPQTRTIYNVTQVSVPVTVNARVIRADNAEIITSVSEMINERTLNEVTARETGLQKGSELIATKIDDALRSYWRNQTTGVRPFELTAIGDASAVSDLESYLLSLEPVSSASLRYMEGKKAVYSVRMKGTLQSFRNALESGGVWRVTGLGEGLARIESSKTTGEVQLRMEAADISISSLEIEPIFPSRLLSYEKREIVKVEFTSSPRARKQTAQVSIIIPALMSLPTQVQVPIEPGKTQVVTLPLMLDQSKLMSIRSAQRFPAQVTVSYDGRGGREKRELIVPTQVFSVNSMDWNEINSIGTFVTYQNPSVNQIARRAVASYERVGMNEQLENAIALYTAVHKHGMTYVIDPVDATAVGLDDAQFPLETLEKQTGDCEDTSILFAALLSAVGIPSGFIVYADHVLTMFDTGIYAKNAQSLGVDRSMVIIHDDKCWIPIETTLWNESFYEAWRVGAEKFRERVNQGHPIDIVTLEEAWQEYSPFPYARTVSLSLPVESISSAISEVQQKSRDALNVQIAQLERAGILSPDQQNLLGMLYARTGDYNKASQWFERVTGRSATVETLNNFGCALLLLGEETRAIEQFEKSLKLRKSEEAMVNLALAHYVGATDGAGVTRFLEILRDVQDMLPPERSLSALLGVDLSGHDGTRASGNQQTAAPQTIDKARLQELIRQQVVERNVSSQPVDESYRDNIMPFGGVRGADPTQVAAIADLICWME